jgi:hypothetical protein
MPPKRSRASTATATPSKRSRNLLPSSQRVSSPSLSRASSSSQAPAASQATEPTQTFELQLRESQQETAAPTESSHAGTTASTVAVDVARHGDSDQDEYDGIDWSRLQQYMKPLATARRATSWIYQHGYCVVERNDPNKIVFICKYCHLHRQPGGRLDVSQATTSAATHLGLRRSGHNLSSDGVKQLQLRDGQRSLRQTLEGGVVVEQHVANTMGNFNTHKFRLATVLCLVDNNLPMELLSKPSFREMISFANPEAEAALWVSPRSVATYAMWLFQSLQPQVVDALSQSAGKIHISFDGWTTKGGKRGFLGIVAHFADASGVIHDLPIALPQLAGAHTGDAISTVIVKTLKEYGITRDKLGYFVLDNAANNDTAVAAIAHVYNFNPEHRRLRCAPHTLNLIGQAVMFGVDQDAFNNVPEELETEELYLKQWRRDGPLGMLTDVINYIKTPQQYELFRRFQREANATLPANERLTILEPVKPVVTRWNSYYAAFRRATQLQAAYSAYAEHHIARINIEDRRAVQHNNKLPDAPGWMRSPGLSAADWAVITEYQDCLEPLKLATEKLEGRGKAGKYGAIYEVIPVFEYVLAQLEARTGQYEHVDFNQLDAPEDHLAINLSAAWAKANTYFSKLDRAPAYYAATCLHPYYKFYCDNSWADKPDWLSTATSNFQRLWATYKPHTLRAPRTVTTPSVRGIDDVIGSFVHRTSVSIEQEDDEYYRWKTQEPQWSQEQYLTDGHPVVYWIQMRSKYPCLSQFAIDILTIPASSCDCERLFSELGDLLEPRRRAIGSELLAALQLIRSWTRAGFEQNTKVNYTNTLAEATDEEIARNYHIEEWQ